MNSNKIFGIGFAHYQGEQNYFNDLIHTALSNGVTYFEACSFYNNYLCEL
jgi:predicted aldo/keto reductase-like oxidoreductase